MSRTDARSDSLRRRPSRTIPATIVGLILLAIGVGLVWTTILALLNGSWPRFLGSFHRWLGALTWGSTLAIIISIGLGVLGLILLICALKAGRPNAVKLNDPAGGSGIGTTEFVMTRRAVARLAAAHANSLDGVDSASASAAPRKVTLAVRTPSAQTGDIAQQVNGRVTQALQAAGLTKVPTVRSNVHTQKP